MESRINKLIRKLLEKFGIKTDKVIGKWNLIGHFKNLFKQALKDQREELYKIASKYLKKQSQNPSHGFFYQMEKEFNEAK